MKVEIDFADAVRDYCQEQRKYPKQLKDSQEVVERYLTDICDNCFNDYDSELQGIINVIKNRGFETQIYEYFKEFLF